MKTMMISTVMLGFVASVTAGTAGVTTLPEASRTASTAGLISVVGPAASCMVLKMGKTVSTNKRQPTIIIFLRPILSDREAKMTKNGVPRARATAMTILAVTKLTLSTVCKKNRA